MRRSEKILIKK